MTTTSLQHRRYSRLGINRLGLWLFILSESGIFAALLFARFYLLGMERASELNQTIGLIITSILLISSLTAYRAETAIAHGDRETFLRSILVTILLGAVFVIGVGIEWSQAFVHFPPNELFGTVFFSMTGMHAFHVLTGLIMLALLYLNGRRGAYSAKDHWGPEAVVKYWHFVDVVWVFFYPALYLIS
jgi:cytochrome c oxidase subunit III